MGVCANCSETVPEGSSVCPRCGAAPPTGATPTCDASPQQGAPTDRKLGVTILRWLAMIPSALLASAFVSIILELASAAYESSGWGETSPLLEMLGRAGLMAGAFVFTGTFVAPKRHVAVALFLASLYSLATAVYAYAVIASGSYSFDGPNWVVVLSVVVAIVVAFGVALKGGWDDI